MYVLKYYICTLNIITLKAHISVVEGLYKLKFIIIIIIIIIKTEITLLSDSVVRYFTITMNKFISSSDRHVHPAVP